MNRFEFIVKRQHKAMSKIAAANSDRWIKSIRLKRSKTLTLASATDGKVLAVVPIHDLSESAAQDEAFIPAALMAKQKTGINTRCNVNGKIEIAAGDSTTTAPFPEGRFPLVESALPLPQFVSLRRHIHIDAKLLHSLAEAITDDDSNPVVSLFIGDDPGSAIAVVGSDGIGVIMPIAPAEYVTNAAAEKYANIWNQLYPPNEPTEPTPTTEEQDEAAEEARRETEQLYINLVKLSAETIDRLRCCDVDRIIEACPRSELIGFSQWLAERRPEYAETIQTCIDEIKSSEPAIV